MPRELSSWRNSTKEKPHISILNRKVYIGIRIILPGDKITNENDNKPKPRGMGAM
jgi:hypothetical protein